VENFLKNATVCWKLLLGLTYLSACGTVCRLGWTCIVRGGFP